MVKPQLSFDHAPENFPTGPWKPLITNKPHAQVPLEESLDVIENDYGVEQ